MVFWELSMLWYAAAASKLAVSSDFVIQLEDDWDFSVLSSIALIDLSARRLLSKKWPVESESLPGSASAWDFTSLVEFYFSGFRLLIATSDIKLCTMFLVGMTGYESSREAIESSLKSLMLLLRSVLPPHDLVTTRTSVDILLFFESIVSSLAFSAVSCTSSLLESFATGSIMTDVSVSNAFSSSTFSWIFSCNAMIFSYASRIIWFYLACGDFSIASVFSWLNFSLSLQALAFSGDDWEEDLSDSMTSLRSDMFVPPLLGISDESSVSFGLPESC